MGVSACFVSHGRSFLIRGYFLPPKTPIMKSLRSVFQGGSRRLLFCSPAARRHPRLPYGQNFGLTAACALRSTAAANSTRQGGALLADGSRLKA